MSIACEFEYAKPATLKEALGLLGRRMPGGAVPLVGGTDLVAWLRDGTANPGLLVDFKGIEDLRGIRLRAGKLWIGAATHFCRDHGISVW